MKEEMVDKGIATPLQTCPLGAGIDAADDEGEIRNYCYCDCAWFIEDADPKNGEPWRGYCGAIRPLNTEKRV